MKKLATSFPKAAALKQAPWLTQDCHKFASLPPARLLQLPLELILTFEICQTPSYKVKSAGVNTGSAQLCLGACIGWRVPAGARSCTPKWVLHPRLGHAPPSYSISVSPQQGESRAGSLPPPCKGRSTSYPRAEQSHEDMPIVGRAVRVLSCSSSTPQELSTLPVGAQQQGALPVPSPSAQIWVLEAPKGHPRPFYQEPLLMQEDICQRSGTSRCPDSRGVGLLLCHLLGLSDHGRGDEARATSCSQHSGTRAPKQGCKQAEEMAGSFCSS